MVSQQFQILVFAQIALCQLALGAMQKRGSGLIINVSSLAARLPVPFMSAYNAAKAALASFTMSLQLELEGSDIRVIDLQPGDIHTDFNNAVTKTSDVDARYRARAEQTWRVLDRNMRAAPKPELVARRIATLIEAANPPPRSTVGDVFQSRIAPLIFRVLPQRVRIWGLKKYYEI